MLRSIKHNLAGLVRFSGRDTRGMFWPYALILFLIASQAMALAFAPTFLGAFARIQRFATDHPDLATVASGPGSYTIEIKGNHPELMPDLTGLLTPVAILSLSFIVLIAAAVARRLHDRGMSGAWGLCPVLFLPTAFWQMSVMMHSFQKTAPDMGAFLLLFLNNVAYLVALGWLIYLLAGDGTFGANRYGADPAPARAQRGQRANRRTF